MTVYFCSIFISSAGHSYCINTLLFQKSAQNSSIFSFISVTGIYLISKSVCCTAPLWWLYGHVTAPYKLSYYYYYYYYYYRPYLIPLQASSTNAECHVNFNFVLQLSLKVTEIGTNRKPINVQNNNDTSRSKQHFRYNGKNCLWGSGGTIIN